MNFKSTIIRERHKIKEPLVEMRRRRAHLLLSKFSLNLRNAEEPKSDKKKSNPMKDLAG